VKIFVNKERSGWILDEIRGDYKKFTRNNLVGIKDADIIWLLNFWDFNSMIGQCKAPVFISIHHVPKHKIKQFSFNLYNEYASGCIVPNKKTEEVLRKYLTIPIYVVPYWILSKMMRPTNSQVVERKKELSPNNEILIGSFQKDSEGSTEKPKLEKGPDIFLDVVLGLKKQHNIKVVLTGYNRKYLISNFNKHDVPFVFYEQASVDDLNLLYDCLDWYFVTSRSEGGPQGVLEASYHKVKILSTDVGMAPDVLHSDCICRNVSEFIEKFNQNIDRREDNYRTVEAEYTPQLIVERLDDFFEKQIDKVK